MLNVLIIAATGFVLITIIFKEVVRQLKRQKELKKRLEEMKKNINWR